MKVFLQRPILNLQINGEDTTLPWSLPGDADKLSVHMVDFMNYKVLLKTGEYDIFQIPLIQYKIYTFSQCGDFELKQGFGLQ